MKKQNYQIKIFALNNNKYCFSINKFNSLEHNLLIPGCQSMYNYAHDAYTQAKDIVKNKNIHIDAITRSAFEQYFDEGIKDVTVKDSSADDMLSEHYNNLYEVVTEKATGIEKNEKYEDNRKVIYYEIKSIVESILKVLSKIEEDDDKKTLNKLINKFSTLTKKYFNDLLLKDAKEEKDKNKTDKIVKEEKNELNEQLESTPEDGMAVERSIASLNEQQEPKTSPKQSNVFSNSYFQKFSSLNKIKLSESDKNEIIENYIDCICNTLKKNHNGIIGKIKNNKIIFSENNNPILSVQLNDDAEIIGVNSLGCLSDMHPYHSLSFYQLYFKPILTSINHFVYVKNNNSKYLILGCRLPDVKNTTCRSEMKLWDINNKEEKIASILFDTINKIWKIDASGLIKKEASSFTPSKYTEQDYYKNGVPAIVVCIDPNLESIYRKTGAVKQVIPVQNHIELDVDFGNKIIRLREEKIEIVNF